MTRPGATRREFAIRAIGALGVASLPLAAGRPVAAGEPVGEIGDSASLEGAGLYFEIRVGGQPVDPLHWLAPRGLLGP